MNERIKQVRTRAALTMEEFGARIGITKSSISTIESGKSNPSDQTLRLICHEFGISYEWLKYGTGEMLIQEDEDEAVNRLMLGGTEFQKKMFRALANQPPPFWEAVESFLDSLKKDGQ